MEFSHRSHEFGLVHAPEQFGDIQQLAFAGAMGAHVLRLLDGEQNVSVQWQ
jgi:hypothetical protein